MSLHKEKPLATVNTTAGAEWEEMLKVQEGNLIKHRINAKVAETMIKLAKEESELEKKKLI